MRIVLTGASGYIGKNVLRYAYRNLDVDVIGIVRREVSKNEKIKGCQYIEMDIAESVQNGRFGDLFQPDDCLIHLAYRNGFDHYSNTHFRDLSWHYELIEQAVKAGCKNINVMGTVHEIGYFEGAVTNSTECNPITPYGIAKNALRQAALSLSKTEGFSLKWLRGFYIYGDDENSHSIFGKLLRACRNSVTVPEFNLTTGLNQFDFINVDKLAEMILAASLQTEVTGIINTCSGRPVSLKVAIENYVKANNLRVTLNFGKYPERKAESPCIYGNNQIISKILINSCITK